MKKSLLLLIIPLFLAGCASIATNEITWQGLYYPNSEYPNNSILEQQKLAEAPTFDSIQACLNWGEDLIKNNQNAAFECSYGCRLVKKWDAIICKDTTKMILDINDTRLK